MVGRLLVGFVWFYLQFSVSWLVDFQWGSCDSIFSFVLHGRQILWGSCTSIFSFLYHGWQTFSGVRVAQSLVFCVMVGRLLVGFVWLNLQFSVAWLVDFQLDSCGSIFCFLCHGWETFSGVRVAQSVVFCAMVGILLWGSCGSIFSFLRHGRQTFTGVRVAQSLVFCVMVCRLLVGFVWFYLQFSVSWLVDIQWGSCGSIFSFVFHGRQTFVGFVWLNFQFSVSWLVDFQWDSCGSIFSFLRHGRQTFTGVPVTQSFVFCVMVGRLLVGFVWLNLQFSVSWQVDFQWGSCDSIFSFLCNGWQTFSGVRVAQSLVFCVMVGRFLVGFVWLNLVFCVMVGRLLVGFVWLNLQVSVSWQVDFQRGSCGSMFSFLCHGWQTFSWVRVAQSLVLCHGWQTCRGVRATLSLVFCVMVGRLLVGFVWLNIQISVSWQVEFQWGLFGSIFSFLCHGRQIVSGVRVAQSSFLCHGWQTFSGVRVAQSLGFCVMVGRLLAGLVWLNLQFSVSQLVDFQWGSCGSIFSFVSWQVDFQGGSCGSIFSFLCHGWQTFRGVRVAQSLVFCVMVGRLLAVLVWLNLQFSVSWLVDFQWGSCGSIFSFVSWQVDFQGGSCGSIFSFMCHG